MIGNRRRHARQVINSPVYVVLGSSSGGLLYDISEGGLAVDIVGPTLTDELIDLGFEMPETERHFEASGQTTWKKEPGSRAGLRFVNLPEASHQQIKEWLSVRAIPGGFGDIASPSDAAKTKWFDPPSMQRETLSEAPVPGSAAEVSQVLANDAAAPEYTDARPTAFTTLGSSSADEGTVSRSEGNYEVTDLRHSLFRRGTVGESRGGNRGHQGDCFQGPCTRNRTVIESDYGHECDAARAAWPWQVKGSSRCRSRTPSFECCPLA